MKRLIVLLLGIPAVCFAASPETATATRVDVPPVLDGVINPDEYGGEPVSGFKQEIPVLGAEPFNKTEVYVAFDNDALYFAFVCFEKNVSGLVANEMIRDSYLHNDDSINVMIDSDNDNDSAYDLMVNCKGVIYDGFFSTDGTVGGREWDGVWDAETSVGTDRWFCEIRFPWDNMKYNTNTSEIGLQFMRMQQQENETQFWASDGQIINRVSTFGTLTGIEGLEPPKRFTILPYATVRGEQSPSLVNDEELESEFEYDGGFYFSFNGGKVFQFNGTFNPDYAQIEADQEDINLTPGINYLQEKRPFFTDANPAFRNIYYETFYTRSMTEIAGGATANGAIGPISYAVIDVQMEDDDPQFPDDNISAIRLKGSIYDASYIGTKLVYRNGSGKISRERDLSYSNAVGLIDAIFALPQNIKIKAEYAKSQTDWFDIVEPTESGKDDAYVVKISKTAPGLMTMIEYSEMAENFNTDTSYYQAYHLNTRGAVCFVDKTFRVNKNIIRDLKFFAIYNHKWWIDDSRSSYNVVESYFDFIFTNGLIVGPFVNLGYDDRYAIYGDERYEIDRYGLYVATESMSWGSASVFFWNGEYYGTKYKNLECKITFLPFPTLRLELETEYIDPLYDASDAEYGTKADNEMLLANIKVTNNILDNLYWRAIVQGDNEEDSYLGSLLVGWEYLPGSNAYLAYEEERLNGDDGLELVDRRIFLKSSYMLTL